MCVHACVRARANPLLCLHLCLRLSTWCFFVSLRASPPLPLPHTLIQFLVHPRASHPRPSLRDTECVRRLRSPSHQRLSMLPPSLGKADCSPSFFRAHACARVCAVGVRVCVPLPVLFPSCVPICLCNCHTSLVAATLPVPASALVPAPAFPSDPGLGGFFLPTCLPSLPVPHYSFLPFLLPNLPASPSSFPSLPS